MMRLPSMSITSRSDLVAMIPYLVGYRPAAGEMVALILHADDRLTGIAVLSLPQADRPGGAVDRLARVAAAARAVILVGYGPADQVSAGIATAAQALRSEGVVVAQRLRVDGECWWHLGCGGCCPAGGTHFDASATSAAATATVFGLVAHPSRTAMAAQFGPVAEASSPGMADALRLSRHALDSYLALLAGGKLSAEDMFDWFARHLAAAHTLYRAGRRLPTWQAASLLTLLGVPTLRGLAAHVATGSPADIAMWTDLVRRAPATHRSAPANLLAISALRDGDGVLADIALTCAQQASPGDELAQLLREAIAMNISPKEMTEFVNPAHPDGSSQ